MGFRRFALLRAQWPLAVLWADNVRHQFRDSERVACSALSECNCTFAGSCLKVSGEATGESLFDSHVDPDCTGNLAVAGFPTDASQPAELVVDRGDGWCGGLGRRSLVVACRNFACEATYHGRACFAKSG